MHRWIAASVLASLCSPPFAANCVAVLAEGGAVNFRIMQAGAPFSGAFRRFSGELCFARGDIVRIDVQLDPASVDSGLPELDAALKEREFFAVREFPRLRFVSSSVQARGEAHVARGTLDIKGNRREVEIRFRLERGGARPVVSGTFALDRLHYGIGNGEWANTAWLGAEVGVEFRAMLAGAP